MNRKLLVIFCLIIAAIFLYWVGSNLIEQILVWFDVPLTGKGLFEARSQQDYMSLLYVNGPALLITLVALVSVLRNKKLMGFFIDATGELQKVSTPTPKEAGQSAIVVVVIVLISVALLTFYDFIWQYAVLFVM